MCNYTARGAVVEAFVGSIKTEIAFGKIDKKTGGCVTTLPDYSRKANELTINLTAYVDGI